MPRRAGDRPIRPEAGKQASLSTSPVNSSRHAPPFPLSAGCSRCFKELHPGSYQIEPWAGTGEHRTGNRKEIIYTVYNIRREEKMANGGRSGSVVRGFALSSVFWLLVGL